MSGGTDKTNAPHVGMAVFAIGTMSLGLAVGFQALRLMDRIDGLLAKVFSRKGMGEAVVSLDPVVLWLGTALLAFALPAVILNVPGAWKRLVVWVGTLLLTFSWAPVLLLAARKPEIGVALVAVLWSGFCAMFYAMNHKLPVDAPVAQPLKTNHGTD